MRSPLSIAKAKWGSRAKTRQANVTDPDSRVLKDGRRYLQGYNAQAAVSEDQMVVAAEMTNAARDSTVFEKMVTATGANLTAAGGSQPETLVADAGYWDSHNATLEIAAEVLIVPIPATVGITNPEDPRIAQRTEVIGRLDRGEVSVRQAATEMGVSTPGLASSWPITETAVSTPP